jgi:hypothetical protein
MRARHLRSVGLLLLLVCLPAFTGCGGGVVELALTAQRLYGGWRIWKVFDDGQPSWIEVASALLQFYKSWTYKFDFLDGTGNVVQSETGTWSVEDGVLVLLVSQSTIDPDAEGKTLRLPGHLEGSDRLSLTRRVTTGQVTVSQEQIYRREAAEPPS